MIHQEIIEKIRKCLALSQSANEHEAAAALAKAKALMQEYGITQAAVDIADIKESSAKGSGTKRISEWESNLISTVCRAMEVDCVIGGTKLDIRFIGQSVNVEIAKYAFETLYRQVKKARKAYISTKLKRCKLNTKRRRADVFCEGWTMAVYRKISALAPQQKNDPLISQYLEAQYPSLGQMEARTIQPSSRKEWEDWFKGSSEGREVNLHHGVGAAAPLALT